MSKTTCPTCHGRGEIPEGPGVSKTCPQCEGFGSIADARVIIVRVGHLAGANLQNALDPDLRAYQLFERIDDRGTYVWQPLTGRKNDPVDLKTARERLRREQAR